MVIESNFEKPESGTRRYDLDWLRVLAILTVFVFHCGRFFDTDGWHVKNPIRHEAVQVWTGFLAFWLMPLIFVISGASTFYALRSKAAGRFVKDRALRLLVPLVVGIFTHVSLQVYLERVTSFKFKGSFIDFYPHYFDGFYGSGGNFAWMGLHLWYLEMLFVFSMVLLPLFLWLKGDTGSRLIQRIGTLLAKPFLRYANEAVLPFYILHQTVILTIGYFVVRWAIPDLAKFGIIGITAFVLVVAIYEFVVRRYNAMRFLFGMKLQASGSARPGSRPSNDRGKPRMHNALFSPEVKRSNIKRIVL